MNLPTEEQLAAVHAFLYAHLSRPVKSEAWVRLRLDAVPRMRLRRRTRWLPKGGGLTWLM